MKRDIKPLDVNRLTFEDGFASQEMRTVGRVANSPRGSETERVISGMEALPDIEPIISESLEFAQAHGLVWTNLETGRLAEPRSLPQDLRDFFASTTPHSDEWYLFKIWLAYSSALILRDGVCRRWIELKRIADGATRIGALARDLQLSRMHKANAARGKTVRAGAASGGKMRASLHPQDDGLMLEFHEAVSRGRSQRETAGKLARREGLKPETLRKRYRRWLHAHRPSN